MKDVTQGKKAHDNKAKKEKKAKEHAAFEKKIEVYYIMAEYVGKG